MNVMSLQQIRVWLQQNQRRRKLGEAVPTMAELADRAGVSRQTLYALLNDKRSEFGYVAQVRLSQVIQGFAANPSYQSSRLMQVAIGPGQPRIRFFGQ
jgi:AcrR family transcriptional regulator